MQSTSRGNGRLGGDIVEVLALEGGETGELEMRLLRAALWLRHNRHGGVVRVVRALAMLERSGLLWIRPGEKSGWTRSEPRAGLTERALQILRTRGLEALREQACGFAAPGPAPE